MYGLYTRCMKTSIRRIHNNSLQNGNPIMKMHKYGRNGREQPIIHRKYTAYAAESGCILFQDNE